MKYLLHVFLTFMLLIFSNCSRAEQSAISKIDSLKNKKILIVYLSRTKNTEAVAKMIQEQVGGDLLALELQNPYPENYQAHVNQVAAENASDFLPPLKTIIESIQKYDVVFIGFPTWGMRLPPPIKTFLTEYDLSGKTIVPFNTNAGYGVGSGFETIKAFCPHSKVLEGFSVEGGKERDGILFVMQGEKEIQVKQTVYNWLKQWKF